MSEKEKKSGFKWFEKLKKVKHIEIYVAVIFIVILLLIYLGNFSNGESKSKVQSGDLSVSQYIQDLETNLEEILSSIGGVSDVKVMITLEMTQAEVSGSQIQLSSFPGIKGVIVTAKGVNNTATKLKVLHAVESVITINNGNIEILSSE